MAQKPRAQDERGCGAEAAECLKDQVWWESGRSDSEVVKQQTNTQNKGIMSGVDGVPRTLPNPGREDQVSGGGDNSSD